MVKKMKRGSLIWSNLPVKIKSSNSVFGLKSGNIDYGFLI